jgi:hypothetical protein
MKHFGIFIADLESERFLAASNDQIATWLFLHAFCSKQTNGGTIENASALPERFWNRHGIAKNILGSPSPLWSWTGDSLSVEPYDIHGESLYLKKLSGGKAGADKRWKGTPNGTPISTPISTPNGTPNAPNLTQPNLTEPNPTKPNHTPPNPPRGDGEAKTPKPRIPTSPEAKTIAELYGRRPTTAWSDKEVRALKAILPVDPEDLALVARYTKAEMAKGENGRHRRDLATFLSNFPGELDRARNRSPETNGSHQPAGKSFTSKDVWI